MEQLASETSLELHTERKESRMDCRDIWHSEMLCPNISTCSNLTISYQSYGLCLATVLTGPLNCHAIKKNWVAFTSHLLGAGL